MSELFNRAFQSKYTKVSYAYVESDEREPDSSSSVSRYRFRLKESLQNVYAMEIVGWSLPFDITPTFSPFNPFVPNIPGDDKVDFSLRTNVGPPNETTFTVTMPPFQFYYNSGDIPNRAFADILVQLMQSAIDSDPNYGAGQVEFFSRYDSFERTSIEIRSNAPFADTDYVELRFLFASGPNAGNNASVQLGFLPDTDSAYSVSEGTTVPLQVIVSPLAVKLIPRPYIDVYIAQYDAQGGQTGVASTATHVRRIYTTTRVFNESYSSEIGLGPDRAHRLMPISNDYVEFLDILIRMSNNAPPPTQKDHSLVLCLYSLIPTIQPPPGTYKQIKKD
jgi:hypothetical protein